MVRSLIDIYRFEGWLPDCRMDLCKGYTQGGSNADIVLADTFLKGFTDGIDWDTGYEAVLKDAQGSTIFPLPEMSFIVQRLIFPAAEPPVWSIEGRGGLASWKSLNYVPADDFDPYGVGPFTRSVSRTVEYAYNDFAIGEMALSLNKSADAEQLFTSSSYWVNLFKEDQTSFLNISQSNASLQDSGFSGFLQPRYLNQTFGYQDPSLCSLLYNFTSCYLK